MIFYKNKNMLFSECAHQTFIFDGRCYNTCPERSFIVEESTSEGKGLSVKKKRHVMNIDESDSLQDIIERTEYVVKNRAIATSSLAQKLCGSCHESCLKCNGPTENKCITCDIDYNRIIIGSGIICLPKSSTPMSPLSSTSAPGNALDDDNGNLTTLNSISNQLKNYSIEKIILISTAFGTLFMFTCICIYLLINKCHCDLLSSFYNKTKQFLYKASGSNIKASSSSLSTNREKYSYDIVEMEERSPLTNNLPDNHIDDDDNSDSDA
jgi:hypothetical protein